MEYTQKTSPKDLGAILKGVRAQADMESMCFAAVTGEREVENQLSLNTWAEAITFTDLRTAQENYANIHPVLMHINDGKKPDHHQLRNLPREMCLLLKEWNRLYIDQDGLLKHKSPSYEQLVLPKKFCMTVIKELHNNMGHLGADRVFQLARERFYWPRVFSEIQTYVMKVCRCIICGKPVVQAKAPLKPLTSTMPMELISIDFLHLERSSGGREHILVIVDNFTRFAQAYPTKNNTAKTVAERLFNDFFLRFGFAEKILHDKGREFENKLFHHLERLSGVRRLRTTPYHPQCNG